MKKVSLFALFLSGLLLLNCTETEDAIADNKIGLENFSEDLITGKVNLGGHDLSYISKAIGELHFQIQLKVDNDILDATIYYDKENIEFNGHDSRLDEDQKEMMLVLGELFAQHILEVKNTEVNMTEYAFISVLEYWAKSPIDYQYSQRSVITNKSGDQMLRSRNEGVSCIRKNTYVNAEYDDASGNHSDNVRVGYYARSGYGCMGRCGADCGRWWIPSSWTKDCLDHDQCSHLNNSSGGASDTNCGDEFNEAADDWLFGVWTGCRG